MSHSYNCQLPFRDCSCCGCLNAALRESVRKLSAELAEVRRIARQEAPPQVPFAATETTDAVAALWGKWQAAERYSSQLVLQIVGLLPPSLRKEVALKAFLPPKEPGRQGP